MCWPVVIYAIVTTEAVIAALAYAGMRINRDGFWWNFRFLHILIVSYAAVVAPIVGLIKLGEWIYNTSCGG